MFLKVFDLCDLVESLAEGNERMFCEEDKNLCGDFYWAEALCTSFHFIFIYINRFCIHGVFIVK
jgi:hypothetical protein